MRRPILRWGGRRVAVAAGAILMLPVSARAVSPAPPLSVTAAALIEESTGRPLYGLSGESEVAIASTTALLTLERVHRLNTTYTQNNYIPAPGDSQIGLLPGQRMSVHDLLIALLL